MSQANNLAWKFDLSMQETTVISLQSGSNINRFQGKDQRL